MKSLKAQKYYIGISSGFHDGALALVNEEGKIVFAEATERFTQNKRSLTSVADNYFLSDKILNAYDFNDYEIGINWKLFDSIYKNLISSFAIFIIRRYKKFNYLVGKFIFNIDVNLFSTVSDFQASSQFAMLSTVGASFKNAAYLKLKLPYKANSYFDHHTCHAYHAYYTSCVDYATILILDGNGDNHISYSIFSAQGQSLDKVYKNNTRASLGDFYGEITKWCGFSEIAGEQWKVMGMAPYGQINNLLYADLENWFIIENLNIKKSNTEQNIKRKILANEYQNLSKQDIAFTCQIFYETLIINLINNIYKKYPSKNLIIAGGCALNSSSNGKIHVGTPYQNVFVPSAPADDGCAVGAALLNYKKHNPQKTIPHFQTNPYLGFNITEDETQSLIKYSGYAYIKTSYDELYSKTASYLKDGKIIAWVQGRAEFGPRALGNRSILANPCLPGMKDKINAEVKFREEFRPFAPSVLEEHAADYFENYFPTPYMERVLNIKKDKQKLIPAVTHVDGTGRLQTVSKEMNLHYYNLIHEFYKLTNIPIVLNTSLNVMGKPIVNSISDITSVFALSGIDVLIINDYIIYKNR